MFPQFFYLVLGQQRLVEQRAQHPCCLTANFGRQIFSAQQLSFNVIIFRNEKFTDIDIGQQLITVMVQSLEQ